MAPLLILSLEYFVTPKREVRSAIPPLLGLWFWLPRHSVIAGSPSEGSEDMRIGMGIPPRTTWDSKR